MSLDTKNIISRGKNEYAIIYKLQKNSTGTKLTPVFRNYKFL